LIILDFVNNAVCRINTPAPASLLFVPQKSLLADAEKRGRTPSFPCILLHCINQIPRPDA
jgi:hypothetical protein